MSVQPALVRPETAVLMVVDFQEKLLPAIHEADACLEAGRRMIAAAGVLELPVVLTEQYPQGLGHTCPSIRDALEAIDGSDGGHPIEKTRFSACVETVEQRLRDIRRPNVILVGIEAHVCVQQTVLELLRLGYQPYVCVDAIGSRRPLDKDVAIERMRQGGAVLTTTESVTFEMLQEAGTEAFKRVLKIVK